MAAPVTEEMLLPGECLAQGSHDFTCIELGLLLELFLWLVILRPHSRHHSNPVGLHVFQQSLPPPE